VVDEGWRRRPRRARRLPGVPRRSGGRRGPRRTGRPARRRRVRDPDGAAEPPGLRLEDRLYDALDDAGVRFETGNPVVGIETEADGTIEAVAVDRKGRETPYGADAFVLATGGLVGKGLDSNREGVREPVFGLHVEQPADRYEWFVDDAFGDQPYARFGVRIDEDGRVLDADGESAYENVFAAGGVVGGADVAREKSASGVSLATGIVGGGRRQRRQPNDTTHGRRRRGRRRGERDERDERSGRPRQPGSPSPGVPEAGRDEQPSIFVPDDGEPKETAATDGGVESATGGSDSTELNPDAYDPVVFPGGDLDLREGADSCYKCTSCDTSCPVAEVDEESGAEVPGAGTVAAQAQGGPRHRRVDHLLFELHAL